VCGVLGICRLNLSSQIFVQVQKRDQSLHAFVGALVQNRFHSAFLVLQQFHREPQETICFRGVQPERFRCVQAHHARREILDVCVFNPLLRLGSVPVEERGFDYRDGLHQDTFARPRIHFQGVQIDQQVKNSRDPKFVDAQALAMHPIDSHSFGGRDSERTS
jgi:hypothetical protein